MPKPFMRIVVLVSVALTATNAEARFGSGRFGSEAGLYRFSNHDGFSSHVPFERDPSDRVRSDVRDTGRRGTGSRTYGFDRRSRDGRSERWAQSAHSHGGHERSRGHNHRFDPEDGAEFGATLGEN